MKPPFGITSEPFLFLHSGIFTVNTYCLPQLMLSKLCQNVYNSSVCVSLSTEQYSEEENRVQTSAASWLKLIPMLSLGLVMVTILFVGSIADMIGKRRAMIIFPVLTLIQAIIFLVLSRVKGHFQPAWLIIPTAVPALLGETQGALLLGLAYKADVTKLSERTKGIAAGEGFLYIAVAIFSFLSGLLLKVGGFDAAFILNITLSIVSFTYVVLVLPDERRGDAQETDHLLQDTKSDKDGTKAVEGTKDEAVLQASKAEEERKLNFISLLRMESVRDVLRQRVEGHSIAIYLVFLFFGVISITGLPYVGLLYLSHSPFGLKTTKLGLMVFTSYLAQALGAWLLIPMLQRYLKFSDLQVLVVGYTGICLYFSAIAAASKTWMLYLAQLLAPFMVIVLPVSRSLLTKHVPDDLHGSVLAVAEFTDSLGCLITSFLGNLIYAKSVSFFPGTVMFVYAFVGLLGLMTVLIFMKLRNVMESTKQ